MRAVARLLRDACVKPHRLSYKCVCERSPSRRESHNEGGFIKVGREDGFTGEHLDGEHSWMSGSSAAILAAVRSNVQVLQNFISEEEEAAFLKELDPGLKRKRYEFDHWDDVRRHIFLHCFPCCFDVGQILEPASQFSPLVTVRRFPHENRKNP